MRSKIFDSIQVTIFLVGIYYFVNSLNYFNSLSVSMDPNSTEVIINRLVISLALIGGPLFMIAIRLQHRALSTRKLHKKVYDNGNMEFRCQKVEVINSANDTDESKHQDLLEKLTEIASMHHLVPRLRIYHTDERYVNLGRVGKVISLSVTTTTLKTLSIEQLLSLYGEGIIFNELETQGLFNEPEDPFPTNYFVPMGAIQVYVLACWLHIQSKRMLVKTDQLLKNNEKGSIQNRQQQYIERYKFENEMWLS
jgi:hypothetical protein